MILGILSIISLIIGIILLGYGLDEGDIFWNGIGIGMIIFGLVGTIVFVDINAEVIKQWFTI